MNIILRVVLAVFFTVLAVVTAIAGVKLLQQRMGGHVWEYRYSLFSVLGGGAFVFWRQGSNFYRTLEHEATHVIFAVLTLNRPSHMVVTADRGGEAGYVGRGNFLISVSPYFFPLTAAILSAVLAVAKSDWRQGLAYVVLGALGYHLAAVQKEVRIGQPDLINLNYLFSVPATLGLLLPVWMFFFCNAIWGWLGVQHYYWLCERTAISLWRMVA